MLQHLKFWRQPRRLYAPGLALLSAIVLRLQLIADFRYSFVESVRYGFFSGVVRDFLPLAFVAIVATTLWGVLGIRRNRVWALLIPLLWAPQLANVLYFKFFNVPLDWWIVRLHWSDAFVVGDSAGDLAFTLPVLLSAALCVAASIVAWFTPHFDKSPDPAPRAKVAVIWALGIVLWAFAAWRLPPALGVQGETRPLDDTAVRMWLAQNFRKNLFVGVGSGWMSNLAGGDAPGAVMASYRDLNGDQIPTGFTDDPWPLVRDFEVDPQTTAALRKQLGLPAEGPVHVLALFLESVRSLEVQRNDIGDAVWPNLRRVIRNHGVEFTQTYSSSFNAGQTVRGQFSTLCSMLPNITGAATYLAHSRVRLTCLQQYLGDRGYLSTWFNSHSRAFHGKEAFERLHGTETFYDQEFYRAQGISQKFGKWGLADVPFLEATATKLGELAKQDRPVFANILTISTHHPYSVIKEGELPDWLVKKTKKHPTYHGYLSRSRYADKAVGAFFEKLFADPMADNTVVVLLGDHGSGAKPYFKQTYVQSREMRYRIPMALITKNMPTPGKVHTPVHQADVAPTVARIVGGDASKVTWIGRGLFAERGTPWVYQQGKSLFYRVGNRACYGRRGKMHCYDVTGKDPLFDRDINKVEENEQASDYFRKVLRANMQAIAFNRVAPP